MKRAQASEEASGAKRRRVLYSTYQKWRRDFDRDHKTVSWLGCETEFSEGKRVVVRLNCLVCSKYKDRIIGRRNYSDRWIVGADSVLSLRVTFATMPTATNMATQCLCAYVQRHCVAVLREQAAEEIQIYTSSDGPTDTVMPSLLDDWDHWVDIA